jgi:RNA-binding protein
VSLTSKQQQFLKALAHPLKPVVQVGNKGLTPEVCTQIADQLAAHELIKVRWNSETPHQPADSVSMIERQTRSSVVQRAGRILTLYRRHDTKPKIVLPPSGVEGT